MNFSLKSKQANKKPEEEAYSVVISGETCWESEDQAMDLIIMEPTLPLLSAFQLGFLNVSRNKNFSLLTSSAICVLWALKCILMISILWTGDDFVPLIALKNK